MILEGSNKGTLLGWFQSSNLAGVFSPQPLFSRSRYVCVCVCGTCVFVFTVIRLPASPPTPSPRLSGVVFLAAACFIV